ncbi:MAG TPA: hypothetical protein VGH94_03180 [Acidimicrobiales bacterium]
MEPLPLTPLSVGEIISHAVAIYRDRFGDLARAVAVVLLPITAIQLVLRLLFLHDSGGLAILAALVTTVITLLASQVGTAACFQISGGAFVGQRPTWEESLDFGFNRLRPLVVLEIIFGFGVLAGLIAFVLPGIYLAVAWQLAIPVLLFEGLSGTKALARSRELLRGRWWPALGLVLVLALVSVIVDSVLGTILGGLTNSSNDVFNELIGSLEGLASSVITIPLSAAATTLLYVQSLVRRDEVDLGRLASRLGER